MKKLITILSALIGINGAANATENAPTRDQIDVAIESTSDMPISDSIIPISKLLVGSKIIIPTPDGNIKNEKSKFLTGLDNEGNAWLYVYTSEEHINRIFPDGVVVFTTDFKGLKNIVNVNNNFRGIYINSAYPVPNELFKTFFSVVK